MTDHWPLLPETMRAIDALDRVVSGMNERLPQPLLIEDWFQYPANDRDAAIVALTRLVRLVSGLRAAKLLGERGYAQEVGVILRTVDDFCDEVSFLLEGHDESSPSGQAKKFVEDFFAEVIVSKEDLLQRGKGPDRVKRKKIRAGQARFLAPENASNVRDKVGAIDFVFDGFVHGAYPQVMELYEGRSRSFQTKGISGSPNVGAMRRQLLFYVSRSLAVAGLACYALGFAGLGDEARSANSRFCSSDEYPGR